MIVVWVIVAVLALAVIVLLHELGHFLAAKWAGIKVTKFAIGFPPEIVGWQKGETRYSINWIPAGGYVKIFGMSPDDEVSDEELSRSYQGVSAWKRAVVILAGSFVHALVAFILFYISFWPLGAPVAIGTIDKVEKTVKFDSQEIPSPAATIDLRSGDRIIEVDGEPTPDQIDVSEALKSRPDQMVTLTIERGDQTLERTVRLAETEDGKGVLGILFDLKAVRVERSNPLTAFWHATKRMGETTVGILGGLVSLFSLDSLKQIFGLKPRRQEGPRSIVGATQLTFQAAGQGAWYFINILAFLLLFLAIFNLIPLPPFDGGHLMVIIYEKLTGKVMDMRKLAPVSWAVIILLSVLALRLIVMDIVQPLGSPFVP